MTKRKYRWTISGKDVDGNDTLPESIVRIDQRPAFPFMAIASEDGGKIVPAPDEFTFEINDLIENAAAMIRGGSAILKLYDGCGGVIERWQFYDISMKLLPGSGEVWGDDYQAYWELSYKSSSRWSAPIPTYPGFANCPSVEPRKEPMTNQQLIEMLQEDLRNERKHLAFYLQASTMISGLHREELREFLFEEAQGELKHVEQFSELIVHLGGVPGVASNAYRSDLSHPLAILSYAVEMEQQVADIYAGRLRATHEMENAAVAYVHVFYEEQILDSQKTAWEVAKMVKEYSDQ